MLSWFVCRHIFFGMICYSVWKQTPEIMPFGCFKGGISAATGSPMAIAIPADAVSPLASTISSLLPVMSDTTSNKLAYLIEPFVDSEGAICYNLVVKWGFLSMLLFLELIILVWFFMIVQVAVRVVRGNGAGDSRSDDEEDAEDEEEGEDEDKKQHRNGAADGNEDEFYYEEAQALEEEVGVEAIDLDGWKRRTGVKRPISTTTGVSLPGHSDRKELLGRIGCEKQVD